MKRLPIKAAKELAKQYNQSQVILITFDKSTGLTHVVSYGKSLEDCDMAARGANVVKRAIGFPEELCNSVPRRLGGNG